MKVPAWGWITGALLVAGAAGSAGEKSDSATGGAAQVTEEPARTSTSEAIAAVASPVTAATSSTPAIPETTAPITAPPVVTTATELNPFGGDDPEDELMPDVLCLGLQEAQDEIQDHGVFFSRSEDATGQDRSQIIDSNWQVVDQSPAPGASIGEGEAVLYVVKYGEVPNPC